MTVFGWEEWKEFFLRLYSKVESSDVFNRAAQVAFYFSFAFFPLLLSLITLAGIVLDNTDSLKRDLYRYLFQIMPASAYTLVQKTLEEVIENSSGGKLTIGLVITIWSASAGVDALRSSLNAVYELKETRSWWNTKLQSLVLTLLFVLLLALGLIVVSTGWHLFELLLGRIGLLFESDLLTGAVQWISLLAVLLLASEVIYSWLPCHKKFRWIWITPGSLVSIFLWVLFTVGFRFYLQYYNTYNKAYGSLGAVIILMLWMFLSGTSILIGALINSVLKDMSEMRMPHDEETAARAE